MCMCVMCVWVMCMYVNVCMGYGMCMHVCICATLTLTLTLAHYDVTMLTEDIIGIIGLGQNLHQQKIPQSKNMAAADRAFMMKR